MSLKVFPFTSVITIFSSIHPNDPPLLLGQDKTYSLAYNRDQEINTPFAKGVSENSGMATFARVSAAGLCKLMALLGHMSETEEGR